MAFIVCVFLPITKAAINLILVIGGSQSRKNGRRMYVAKIRQDAATHTGHMMIKFIHMAKKAGKSPKARLM